MTHEKNPGIPFYKVTKSQFPEFFSHLEQDALNKGSKLQRRRRLRGRQKNTTDTSLATNPTKDDGNPNSLALAKKGMEPKDRSCPFWKDIYPTGTSVDRREVVQSAKNIGLIKSAQKVTIFFNIFLRYSKVPMDVGSIRNSWPTNFGRIKPRRDTIRTWLTETFAYFFERTPGTKWPKYRLNSNLDWIE